MSKRTVGGRTAAAYGHPAISAMHRTQDLRERLIEDALRNWTAVEDEWMEKCAEVQGNENFMVWYRDDNNVPPYGQSRDRVALLQAHYKTLKVTHADAFYWLEVETQEVEKCMQIEGRDGFREWWESDTFPTNTTPKERVELIRARIANFLTNDSTTQVQARVREIQQALIEKKATNISEVTNELAELRNHLQKVGVEISGEEGESS